MNIKKISQLIGIIALIAITVVSAFTRPSLTPNNNNVYPLIDSYEEQLIKNGTGTEGGFSVDTLLVGQAARFDGMVFIDRFLSGIRPDAPDIVVGTASNRVQTLTQGTIEAGESLRADNLKNNTMQRVCRDRNGVLVLCGGTPAVDECPNIEGIQTEFPRDPFVRKDASGNCFGPDVAAQPTDSCRNIPGIQDSNYASSNNLLISPDNNCLAPTIEGRLINTFTTKKYMFPFGRRTIRWWSSMVTVDLVRPLPSDVSFSFGWCSQLMHNNLNDAYCRGVPASVDSNGVDNAFWNREKARLENRVTIPAGTRYLNWTVFKDPTNPTPTRQYPWAGASFEYELVTFDPSTYSNPYFRGPVPPLDKIVIFDVNDPSGFFNQTNLRSLGSVPIVFK